VVCLEASVSRLVYTCDFRFLAQKNVGEIDTWSSFHRALPEDHLLEDERVDHEVTPDVYWRLHWVYMLLVVVLVSML
jgi:hypothetical protein